MKSAEGREFDPPRSYYIILFALLITCSVRPSSFFLSTIQCMMAAIAVCEILLLLYFARGGAATSRGFQRQEFSAL